MAATNLSIYTLSYQFFRRMKSSQRTKCQTNVDGKKKLLCEQVLMSYFVASEPLFVSSCKCHWSISLKYGSLKIHTNGRWVKLIRLARQTFSCQPDQEDERMKRDENCVVVVAVHNFLHFIFICLCIFKIIKCHTDYDAFVPLAMCVHLQKVNQLI